MKPTPTKMITFIETLYKKYKVLSKLSQKQNNAFQEQIISLLVDPNQNIDTQAYQQIKQEIGLDGFILEVLSTTLNRNSFSNHYQVNKDINNIAQQLERKTVDLVKRTKLVEKKEQQILKTQANIKNRVKQFAHEIEKEILTSISEKQTQMKKQLNNLINQLKSKERILNEKRQEIKTSMKRIEGLDKKQKQVQQKIKYLQKKQTKKTDDKSDRQEVKQLRQKMDDLMRENDSLKRKTKTTDLAYKKAKQNNQQFQQQISSLREQLNKENQILSAQPIIPDQLQISSIKPIHHLPLNLSEEEQQSLMMPECLQNSEQKKWDYSIETDEDRMKFISSNKLNNLIDDCQEQSFKKDHVSNAFDIILQLIEQGRNYKQILMHLNNDKFIQFCEGCYLNHETNVQLVESITLVMSRIGLVNGSLAISANFHRAIKLRAKLEDRDTLLGANIECLMNIVE